LAQEEIGVDGVLRIGTKAGDVDGGLSIAPLLLTGNAIVVAIHLYSGAVLQEEGCFSTRGHLRTVSSSIAFEGIAWYRVNTLGRRWNRNRRQLRFFGFNVCLTHKSIVLVARVGLPSYETDDDQDDETLHDRLWAP
jgi:hypothetical protein